MKRLLLVCFISLMYTIANGQFIISGKVTDKENKPLEFTTIVFEQNTHTQTIYSDSLGNFQIPILPNQNYQIQFSRINYVAKVINLKVSSDTSIIIPLYKIDTFLKEVIVKSNKPVFERKNDKFVFNIGSADIPKGSSAWDILKLTPLVITSEQGSVSISGAAGAKIYINDRKSFFSGEALMNHLKSIFSENVLKIEVITIPSSRFESEGGGGIINIILKKSDTEGIKGSAAISSKQTTFNSQTLNANVNFRKKYFNIYSYLPVANQNLRFVGHTNIDYINYGNLYYKNYNDIQRRLKNKLELTPKAGLDLYISKQSTLGFLFDYANTKLKRDNTTKTSFINKMGLTDSLHKTISTNTERINYFNSNIYYSLLTDTSGGKINISIDHLSYKETRNTVQTTFLSDIEGNSLSNRDRFVSILPQKIFNNSIELDYNRQLNQQTLFEIGSRYSKSTTDNNVVFQVLNSNNQYVNDTTRSNHFKYAEKILALYLNYQKEINGKWSFKIGARLEKTNIERPLINYNQKNKNHYTNLFPTVFINYTPNGMHQFSFAATSRINRPSFWDINPFRYYISNNIYITGNPFLVPSRLFKQEITYTYKSKMILQFIHSKAYNAFALLNYFDSLTTYQKQTNYGVKQHAGINVLYTNKILDFWYLRLGGNLSLINFKGKYESNILDQTTLSSSLETTNGLTISKKNKFYASLNMSNTFKHFAANIKIANQFRANLWLTKISKNDRCVFGLGLTDIFKSAIDNYATIQSSQELYQRYYYDTRGISISFTYRFGKKTIPDKKVRDTSNQEERGRIN